MKSARVIMTLACERHCVYCSNYYQSIMQSAKEIDNIDEVSDFDEILLTGGEPMLFPEKLIKIIEQIRKNSFAAIYLYSAKYTAKMKEIIELVDGIHFTLHSDTSPMDVVDFHTFQSLLSMYPRKSFRLYLNHDIHLPVTVYPYLWKRVEVKPWLTESECKLPENETLFILK